MKKNKMMRIASLMLVLVMITCSAVGGTFAKYVTEASGKDSARVAKWGVELSVNANAFAKEYATDDTTGTDLAVSVKSVDKVVAPGTDSTETNCQGAFSITGSPEVVTKVKVDMTNVSDVKLPKGTYTDYTKVTGYDKDGKQTYDKFTLDADYYPVVWTLKQGTTTLKSGTLAEIKAYLDTYNATNSMCTYAANQSLATSFTLDWAWAFSQNDKADTLLGNIAAGIATVEGAVTTVSYDLTVTATQVD